MFCRGCRSRHRLRNFHTVSNRGRMRQGGCTTSGGKHRKHDALAPCWGCSQGGTGRGRSKGVKIRPFKTRDRARMLRRVRRLARRQQHRGPADAADTRCTHRPSLPTQRHASNNPAEPSDNIGNNKRNALTPPPSACGPCAPRTPGYLPPRWPPWPDLPAAVRQTVSAAAHPPRKGASPPHPTGQRIFPPP